MASALPPEEIVLFHTALRRSRPCSW
jgi:hypothetical protein